MIVLQLRREVRGRVIRTVRAVWDVVRKTIYTLLSTEQQCKKFREIQVKEIATFKMIIHAFCVLNYRTRNPSHLPSIRIFEQWLWSGTIGIRIRFLMVSKHEYYFEHWSLWKTNAMCQAQIRHCVFSLTPECHFNIRHTSFICSSCRRLGHCLMCFGLETSMLLYMTERNLFIRTGSMTLLRYLTFNSGFVGWHPGFRQDRSFVWQSSITWA